jgi:hypothetical protein
MCASLLIEIGVRDFPQGEKRLFHPVVIPVDCVDCVHAIFQIAMYCGEKANGHSPQRRPQIANRYCDVDTAEWRMLAMIG